MTVAELITKLQEFPQEMRVVGHDGEYKDFFDITDIYTTEAANVKELFPGEMVLKLSPFDEKANQ